MQEDGKKLVIFDLDGTFAQHDYRLGDGNQSGIRAIGFPTHSEEAL